MSDLDYIERTASAMAHALNVRAGRHEDGRLSFVDALTAERNWAKLVRKACDSAGGDCVNCPVRTDERYTLAGCPESPCAVAGLADYTAARREIFQANCAEHDADLEMKAAERRLNEPGTDGERYAREVILKGKTAALAKAQLAQVTAFERLEAAKRSARGW